MSSSVGAPNIYEADDQRNYSKADAPHAERFKEGQPNSHLAQDSKDERTIANKLAREEQRERERKHEDSANLLSKKDATLPAKHHGNEPSRGAKIDQELKEDDEAALKKKGSWGPSV